MRSDKDDRNFPAIRLAETAKNDSPTELHQHKLKEFAGRMDQFHSFSKGQFVRWKPGLKNRKFPDYGEPAIVTAILPSPIFDPGEVTAGSPVFSGASDVRPWNIQGGRVSRVPARWPQICTIRLLHRANDRTSFGVDLLIIIVVAYLVYTGTVRLGGVFGAVFIVLVCIVAFYFFFFAGLFGTAIILSDHRSEEQKMYDCLHGYWNNRGYIPPQTNNPNNICYHPQ